MPAAIIRPMLASDAAGTSDLPYPLFASPKFDGIRAVVVRGRLLSRTLKAIPNRHVRETLERFLPSGIDGELIAGTFAETTSAVMSVRGKPDFVFWAFDLVGESFEQPFRERQKALREWHHYADNTDLVRIVPQKWVLNEAELLDYEARVLRAGYEGVMLRDPYGPYKCGRSTKKEAWLLKLKRFQDSEAVILSCIERQHNTNEAIVNDVGYAKRSSSKTGLVGAGTLGAFRVRDLASGCEFEIGSGAGLTDDVRAQLWAQKSELPGKIIKYKHQPHGAVEKPRLPVWLGFRDAMDLGDG